VPADRQAEWIDALRAEVAAGVDVHRLPAARRKVVETLLGELGTPGFYDRVALLEPGRSSGWTSTARVQRRLAAAESTFDAATRAFCESVRLTLHAALVDCVANPRSREGQSLYARFIELHPTAFRQNGGWIGNLRIPLEGVLQLLGSAPLRLLLEAPRLLLGSTFVDPAAIRGAVWVRRARRSLLAAAAPLPPSSVMPRVPSG
jgi:hypothetical protein